MAIANIKVSNPFKRSKGPKIKKEPKYFPSSVHLPFIQGTTNNIAQVLRKHDVSSIFRPLNMICSSLRSFKDLVNPKGMKGLYLIMCSCGTPYIGYNGRSINQRI